MSLVLKDNSIFIADAHYPHYGNTLIDILKSIEMAQIETTQLFLMGDIFDLLFGRNDLIYEYNKEAIDIINRVSQEIEIIYLEGNHDFLLKEIFPNIYTIPRSRQPLILKDKQGRIVCLSHGDRYATGMGYNIYSTILRSYITLSILSPWKRKIIDSIIENLKQKEICKEMYNFSQKVEKITQHYPKDSIIIEGHFHQGRKLDNYISLPSLACSKEIGVYRDGDIEFISVLDLISVDTV